jgi:hypothetical protein
MAIVTRYFSTAAAGAGDGTSWANRAQLHNAGTWSTVITGFSFAGADSLECLIGPGTHTITTNTLATGLFANPPTVANTLFFHGCDSSGVQLEPSNPDWRSAEPVDWDSGLPVLATTTNIATTSLQNCIWRFVKFTASGRNGSVVSSSVKMDWCVVENSTSNTTTSALGFAATSNLSNCSLSCTGSSYSAVMTSSAAMNLINVRIIGVAGSSGNRDGLVFSGTTPIVHCSRVAIVRTGGRGFAYTGSNAAVSTKFVNCLIANNTGDGVLFPNTASQTQVQIFDKCVITGNGGYGINPQGTNTAIALTNSRMRDNTSGNINTSLGNYPTDFSNYTTDSDDATEYVDASSTFNFTIKNTAAIWGKDYGTGDQAASGGFINTRRNTLIGR